MKKLDRAATVRERLRQSAGLPFPDSRGTDFCYFHKSLSCRSRAAPAINENDSPFEGSAGGGPVANMTLESPRTPPYAPLDRWDFQRSCPCRLRWAIEHENYSPPLEGCRGGLFRDGKDPPRRLRPSAPSQEGIFSRESY